MPLGERLHTASSDLKDFFYTFILPEWLRKWFRMRAVPLSEIDHTRARELEAEGHTWATTEMTCPPMGWSWAMFFAQQAHECICERVPELKVQRQ